jgi:type II secretory pathway pseudopilin PulG
LIELLVVVAIIALLIAILLPSLANARDVAKTASCAANMRQVGMAVNLFAAENDNRAPGYASAPSSLAWNDILNAEVFQRAKGTKYAIGGRYGKVSDTKTLSCTKYEPGGATDYSRPWVLNGNLNAANGASTGMDLQNMVDAGGFERQSYYTAAGYGTLTSYHLGSKMNLFASDQIMMHESHAGNDVANNVTTPDPQGRILDEIAGFPGYMAVSSGVSGSGYSRDNIAFRHPFFKGTNMLKMDASVATVQKSESIADDSANKLRSKWKIAR